MSEQGYEWLREWLHEHGMDAAMELLDGLRAEVLALKDQLERQRIAHPTEICSCRFDFSAEPFVMRETCGYHERMVGELKALRALRDRLVAYKIEKYVGAHLDEIIATAESLTKEA